MSYLLSYLLAPSGLLTMALEAVMHLKVDSSEYMIYDQFPVVKCWQAGAIFEPFGLPFLHQKWFHGIPTNFRSCEKNRESSASICPGRVLFCRHCMNATVPQAMFVIFLSAPSYDVLFKGVVQLLYLQLFVLSFFSLSYSFLVVFSAVEMFAFYYCSGFISG
jgi:hypothetical protein